MVDAEATDCMTVEASLERFVDGDLDTARAAQVEDHLARCAGCATACRLARSIRSELRSLPQMEGSAALLRSIKSAAAASEPWWRRGWSGSPTPMRLVGAAAALLLVAALGLLLLPRLAPRPEGPSTALGGPEVGAAGGEEAVAADPQEVERATAEARYALAYVQRVAGRAGLAVREEVFDKNLLRPATQGLTRGLSRLRFEDDTGGQGGGAGA